MLDRGVCAVAIAPSAAKRPATACSSVRAAGACPIWRRSGWSWRADI